MTDEHEVKVVAVDAERLRVVQDSRKSNLPKLLGSLIRYSCFALHVHTVAQHYTAVNKKVQQSAIYLARLEKLRNVADLSWEDLAGRLDLSVSMLMMVRRGERNFSARSLYRLCEAERATGIEIPSEFQKAVKKVGFDKGIGGIKVTHLHDALPPSPQILLADALAEVTELKERIQLLELKLKQIKL